METSRPGRVERSLPDQVQDLVDRLHAESPTLEQFERDYRRAKQPRSVHEYLMWAYHPGAARRVKKHRCRAVLHRYMRADDGG
jgi:hypothetical protein